uniref:Uncharacterized protein n=1 Tax=Micrurus corallinus TaxID=54390 RepID=A0A2D4F5D6_MICCO
MDLPPNRPRPVFLLVRSNPAWDNVVGVHLSKRHIAGQPFLDVSNPLHGNAERGEIRHYPADAVLADKEGQRVFRETNQQVERDVKQPTLLGDFLQASEHKTEVADGGIQEFGHQAEADVQGQALF